MLPQPLSNIFNELNHLKTLVPVSSLFILAARSSQKGDSRCSRVSYQPPNPSLNKYLRPTNFLQMQDRFEITWLWSL